MKRCNSLWDEYHSLLGRLSKIEDILNIPMEDRVIKFFQKEEEKPQYGTAMRILLWLKSKFTEI